MKNLTITQQKLIEGGRVKVCIYDKNGYLVQQFYDNDATYARRTASSICSSHSGWTYVVVNA